MVILLNRRICVEVDLIFKGDDPYYSDDDLGPMTESWIDAALNDRSDLIGWRTKAYAVVHTDEEHL